MVFGENGAMLSHLDLRGRVCLVTGGARGIGRAVAERFIEAGANVAIADIQMDGPTNENGSGSWGKISPFHCDVSDSGSVQAMVKDVTERFGRIDVLVNNAGVVGRCAPIQEQSDEDWGRVMGVDLSGTFYCCRAVIPHMLQSGYGRIVNISSIAGKEGNPNMIPYSTAKAGVIGLTKALGKELAKTPIVVNAVTPGLIETDILGDISPAEIQYAADRIPMGRLGKTGEVAALVHWLSSDEVTFSTGAVFDLSGGRATY